MIDWLVYPIVAVAAWFAWRQLAPRKSGGRGAACGSGCSGCESGKPGAALEQRLP